MKTNPTKWEKIFTYHIYQYQETDIKDLQITQITQQKEKK